MHLDDCDQHEQIHSKRTFRYGEDVSHMDPDPRVQIELENLNTSTEFINKLELELEKARSEFNKLLSDSTEKIESLSKKLGSSINKARPYYEERIAATDLHKKAQVEAMRYEQATSQHNEAKEIVHLAEQSLNEAKDNTDSKLEEILTITAEKVNKSELERLSAEKQHEITSRAYNLTEQRLSKLHKQLKRSIVKASLETRRNFLDINNYANQQQLQLLPYFEMKAQFNQMLDEQIAKIRSYEARVNKAKLNYTKALERLEDLNSKIYENADELDENPKLVNNQCDIPNDDIESLQQISDKSVAGTTCNYSHTDSSIFDNNVLDKLVLEDDLDLTLEQIKNECLLPP